jgi:hypothetical protein
MFFNLFLFPAVTFVSPFPHDVIVIAFSCSCSIIATHCLLQTPAISKVRIICLFITWSHALQFRRVPWKPVVGTIATFCAYVHLAQTIVYLSTIDNP